MLTIAIGNDGSGTEESANYQAVVRVNRDLIYIGRIDGHNRADGWLALVQRFVNSVEPKVASPVPPGSER